MYTEEQIKAAFWAKFHEAGELWFPYPGASPHPEAAKMYCERVTEDSWKEFKAELESAAKAGPNV